MKIAIMAAAAVFALSATAVQAQGNSGNKREQAPAAAPANPGRGGGGETGRGGGGFVRPDAGSMRAQPQQQIQRMDRGDRGSMRDPGAVSPRTYREGRAQRFERRQGDPNYSTTWTRRDRYVGDRWRYRTGDRWRWRNRAAAGFIFLGGPRIIVRGYGPGWCRGLHRGYHWAPWIGWHRGTHRGLFRCW